jgi:hypothetical protein
MTALPGKTAFARVKTQIDSATLQIQNSYYNE